MREALARTDNDFVLSEPRRKGTKRSSAPSFSILALLAKPKQVVQFTAKYANLFMGVAFAGLLTTVLVNALVWQKNRHPAPLFGHSVSIEPEPKTIEAIIQPPAPAAHPAPAPMPQAAVPQTAAPQAAVNTPHGRDPMAEAAQLQSQKPVAARDPITQLLKSSAPPPAAPVESSKSISAAQRALMKLGYVIKPDGVMGPAFRQTLEQFERDHGLAAHGTLTPKVMRELSNLSGVTVD